MKSLDVDLGKMKRGEKLSYIQSYGSWADGIGHPWYGVLDIACNLVYSKAW